MKESPDKSRHNDSEDQCTKGEVDTPRPGDRLTKARASALGEAPDAWIGTKPCRFGLCGAPQSVIPSRPVAGAWEVRAAGSVLGTLPRAQRGPWRGAVEGRRLRICLRNSAWMVTFRTYSRKPIAFAIKDLRLDPVSGGLGSWVQISPLRPIKLDT